MSDMQNILNYFQNVLGVRQILLGGSGERPTSQPYAPSQSQSQSQSQSPTVPQVFVEDYSSYSDGERDLLDKVLSAVGLSLKVCNVTDVREQIDGSLLVFQNQPSLAGSRNTNEFPSPRVMLSQPSLKKQCWQKLQAWMKSNSL